MLSSTWTCKMNRDFEGKKWRRESASWSREFEVDFLCFWWYKCLASFTRNAITLVEVSGDDKDREWYSVYNVYNTSISFSLLLEQPECKIFDVEYDNWMYFYGMRELGVKLGN